MARAGDLVVIFGDKLSQIWQQIVSFKPQAQGGREEMPPKPEALAAEMAVH
jgi:hypothetical protein